MSIYLIFCKKNKSSVEFTINYILINKIYKNIMIIQNIVAEVAKL